MLNNILTQVLLVASLLFLAVPWSNADEKESAHLILLSGQSNMANMDPARVFIPEVEKHFGAENVIVVKFARSGQPIRRWYKNWKVTGDQNPAQIGDLYDRLLREATNALKGKTLKSVTLVWMQGERDAKEKLSDQYEEAFLGILDQIKRDLMANEVRYVIGRLSDSGLGKKDWDNIREIQKKLGEDGRLGAWVNTDDLNDDTRNPDGSARGENDLHYSEAGYDLLAKRYVEKVKELLKEDAK